MLGSSSSEPTHHLLQPIKQQQPQQQDYITLAPSYTSLELIIAPKSIRLNLIQRHAHTSIPQSVILLITFEVLSSTQGHIKTIHTQRWNVNTIKYDMLSSLHTHIPHPRNVHKHHRHMPVPSHTCADAPPSLPSSPPTPPPIHHTTMAGASMEQHHR